VFYLVNAGGSIAAASIGRVKKKPALKRVFFGFIHFTSTPKQRGEIGYIEQPFNFD